MSHLLWKYSIVSYLTLVSDLDLAPPPINSWLLHQLDTHYIQAFAYQWEYAYLPEVNAFPILTFSPILLCTSVRCPGMVKIWSRGGGGCKKLKN